MSSLSAPSAGSLQQWLRNVGAGYGDTLVGAVIFALVTPIIVRHLGIEAYAAWVLSHSITFYLRFFDLGFGEGQVRLHARFAERGRRDLVARLIATVLVCLAVAGVAATVVGVALAYGASASWLEASGALEGDLRTVVAILALNLLVSIPGSTLEHFYEGAQRFDILGLRSMTLRVAAAVLQVALVLDGHGIVALALVELGMSCLAVVIDIFVLRRLMPGLLTSRAAFDRRIWRRIRHFALWTSIDDLVAEGTAHLDELLVVIFLPLALLTPYALCLALAGALLPIVRPLTETFFPMAAALHARRRVPELAKLLVLGTKAVTAIAIPIAIALVFFGNDILRLWVPDAAQAAPGLVITLLACSALLSAALWTSGVLLLAVNRIRLVVALNVAEVAMEVVLIVMLAPRYGLLGVAVASLLANVALGLLVELPLTCRTVHLNPLEFLGRAFGRLAAASVPVVLLAWLIRRLEEHPGWATLSAIALILGAAWLVSLFVIGTGRAERDELRATWRQLRAADTEAS